MNGASSSKRKRKRGGRPKSNYWNEVEKIGDMWKCNHCEGEFHGGATRIKEHIIGGGKNIRKCPHYPASGSITRNQLQGK